MNGLEHTISIDDLTEVEVIEMSPPLRIYKDHPNAVMPKFQTRGSACFDLSVCEYDSIDPGSIKLFHTGLIFDIPKGFMVEIHIRSSLPLKREVTLANNVGIIDSDYVNPIGVMLHNIGDMTQNFAPGDRIAQARMVPVCNYNLEESTEKPGQKENRTGGFGSTGEK